MAFHHQPRAGTIMGGVGDLAQHLVGILGDMRGVQREQHAVGQFEIGLIALVGDMPVAARLFLIHLGGAGGGGGGGA